MLLGQISWIDYTILKNPIENKLWIQSHWIRINLFLSSLIQFMYHLFPPKRKKNVLSHMTLKPKNFKDNLVQSHFVMKEYGAQIKRPKITQFYTIS